MKKRIIFIAAVTMSMMLMGCNQQKQATEVTEISTNEVSSQEVEQVEEELEVEETNQLPSEPAGDYLKDAMNKTMQLKGVTMENIDKMYESSMAVVTKTDETGMIYMSQKLEVTVSEDEAAAEPNLSGEMYITPPDSEGNYDMYANIPEVVEGWTRMTLNVAEQDIGDSTGLEIIERTVSQNAVDGKLAYGDVDEDYVIVVGGKVEPIEKDGETVPVLCIINYYINRETELLEKVEIQSFDRVSYWYQAIITENKEPITIPKEVLEEAVVY